VALAVISACDKDPPIVQAGRSMPTGAPHTHRTGPTEGSIRGVV
jgi:hypothetical protein